MRSEEKVNWFGKEFIDWPTDGNIVYDWDEIFWLLFSTNRHIHRKENKIYILFLKGPHNDIDIDKDIRKRKRIFFLLENKNVSLFRRWCLSSFHRAEENRTKFRLSLLFNFFFRCLTYFMELPSCSAHFLLCRKYLLILFSWIPFQEKKSKFFWTQNELIKFVERILIFFDEAEVLFELE